MVRFDDGGGTEFRRVSEALRARIADGVYRLGSHLPPQRVLAEEFGTSRDTVQRVLRELADEGWIESRLGSGTQVIRTQRIQPLTPRTPMRGRAVTLGSIIGEAFEKPEVALDVYTLTAESLDAHIRVQAERIRAGEIATERIALRMLLPAEDLDLPYPRAKDDPSDPQMRERLLSITRRHTSSLRYALQKLQVKGLVPQVDFRIRHAQLTPAFKLYLLNGTEALHGPYEVTERHIVLEDGKEIEALDVLGLGAPLTHHVTDDDPDSTGSVFVASSQAWFGSVWNLLAR
ncbi:GntR family transcriptional regulator [Streptomyces albicerus]|uniref:GntR family transcriptional regulator n=1 Tax=Streptomyces albicerus TaxID=2569859 RepID=UPI00124B142E|nr:winged helix-turn-helix domain-containing protein [Streptomyces albicerus]